MYITRDELAAVIAAAHKRGFKVTGHLCSVTYREAAELGIDNRDHGFFVAADFVADKKPGTEMPGPGKRPGDKRAALDLNSAAVKSLIAETYQERSRSLRRGLRCSRRVRPASCRAASTCTIRRSENNSSRATLSDRRTRRPLNATLLPGRARTRGRVLSCRWNVACWYRPDRRRRRDSWLFRSART